MGRERPGSYSRGWTPPDYQVDDDAKVVGGYSPEGRNNWGRWGEMDTLGTANLITADTVRHAAGLVRTGEVVSLALPIDDTAPRWSRRPAAQHFFEMTGADGIVGTPFNRVMPGYVYNDDWILMPLQVSTQWDGLAHVGYLDTFYNGYWAGTVTALGGSSELDVAAHRESFVGRGVLLDVAAHLGVDSLEPGFAIGPELLDETAQAQGVEVGSGDILLIRTGYLTRWPGQGTTAEKDEYFAACPGLDVSCAEWLGAKDLAAVANDTAALEVIPWDPEGQPLPLHHRLLVDLGLTVGEMWDLERLARVCRAEGRYEFLLVAPPLHLPGAVGSPLNPIAIL